MTKTELTHSEQDGLEHCTRVQTHVALKDRAVPVFQKCFVMAFTMHDAVEKQLERYVNMGIRICAPGFSTGLVDRLVVDSYLILRLEKLYQAFTGNKYELSEIVILPRYVQLLHCGCLP
ncbi:hypothetical protein T07_6374 [Trichinella nelsoni]|uniref:Uncharacterized protein n=1 Tax=Trichinella nelsoni TaxID=6336 RepID=A0A0V0SL84_9BILA|nr:hypothetical protein T07_6374 [Trichinella nelsoni]